MIEIWKKKLTQYEPHLMLLVDHEMKDKGYKIKKGVARQCYTLGHNLYNHECLITFDIINRRWISAWIYCMEPIQIYNDLMKSEALHNVDCKIEHNEISEKVESLDRLIGQKVIKLLFNKEKNSFAFLLDTLRLEIFNCNGECCSSSWIEHLTGLNNLLYYKVIKIKYIDIDTERDGDEWGEKETLIYRFDIHTEAGMCTMEMRNHSNGYYSGQLTHIDDDDSQYYDNEFEEPKIECKKDF